MFTFTFSYAQMNELEIKTHTSAGVNDIVISVNIISRFLIFNNRKYPPTKKKSSFS